jgi:hypothetical protein
MAEMGDAGTAPVLRAALVQAINALAFTAGYFGGRDETGPLPSQVQAALDAGLAALGLGWARSDSPPVLRDAPPHAVVDQRPQA